MSDVSVALLQAVDSLMTPDRAPTLAEIAAAAQVGTDAASVSLKNMTRSGRLQIVRQRKVAHRNRPVAEYARPEPVESEASKDGHHFDLDRVLTMWVNR